MAEQLSLIPPEIVPLDAHPEIQVWAYTNHVEQWPEQTMAQIYTFMRSDHLPPLFWRDGIPHSLNQFICWTSDPTRIVLIVTCCEEITTLTLDHIMGLCWLDEIEGPHAAVHFWVRKKFWWGKRPHIAAQKVLQLVFQQMPWLYLLTCRVNSQNRLALKFMQQIGARIVGEIPDWYQHGETRYAATFGYLPRMSLE